MKGTLRQKGHILGGIPDQQDLGRLGRRRQLGTANWGQGQVDAGTSGRWVKWAHSQLGVFQVGAWTSGRAPSGRVDNWAPQEIFFRKRCQAAVNFHSRNCAWDWCIRAKSALNIHFRPLSSLRAPISNKI